MLQVIYEKTCGREEPIFVEAISDELGLSDEEANAAWRYLRDKKLIDIFNIPYMARINAKGIDAIENARLYPHEPDSNSPSMPYNYINIQNMVDSTIQQGGAQANMTQTVSNIQENLEDLRRLVEVFDKHVDDLGLEETAKRKALVQVATIKAQLEDDPDPVIVKQAGRTLRNITEGAIGSLIATAAQPIIWTWVAPVIAKLSS